MEIGGLILENLSRGLLGISKTLLSPKRSKGLYVYHFLMLVIGKEFMAYISSCSTPFDALCMPPS